MADEADEITLGLIASLCSISKAIARRPLRSPAVKAALLQLRENVDLAALYHRGVSPPAPSPCSPLEPPLTPTPAPPHPKAGDTPAPLIRAVAKPHAQLALEVQEPINSDIVEVVEFWNKFFSLPRINAIGKRALRVQRALKDTYWRENYQDGIRKLVKTPFCMGKNRRKWIADIEWFSDPANLDKLLTGKYDHTSATSEPPDYAREEI